jgi:hypothetical protein
VYDPRSKGAESYIRLAKEIIERQPSVVSAEPSAESVTTEGTETHGGEPALEEVPAAEKMDKSA